MARREALKNTLSQQRQRCEKQELLAQLDAESVPYKIIWSDLPTTEQPTHWITENFPIAWWGRIDWSIECYHEGELCFGHKPRGVSQV